MTLEENLERLDRLAQEDFEGAVEVAKRNANTDWGAAWLERADVLKRLGNEIDARNAELVKSAVSAAEVHVAKAKNEMDRYVATIAKSRGISEGAAAGVLMLEDDPVMLHLYSKHAEALDSIRTNAVSKATRTVDQEISTLSKEIDAEIEMRNLDKTSVYAKGAGGPKLSTKVEKLHLLYNDRSDAARDVEHRLEQRYVEADLTKRRAEEAAENKTALSKSATALAALNEHVTALAKRSGRSFNDEMSHAIDHDEKAQDLYADYSDELLREGR